jgi:acyl transferase domain-containing protein
LAGVDHKSESVPAAIERNAPLAIIGMACRVPGANSPEEFWQLLLDKRDATRLLPAGRWQGAGVEVKTGIGPGCVTTLRGGFFAEENRAVDLFDADLFGIGHREAEIMDPQQRLLLEMAWEALERAGLNADSLAGSNTGVFVGISTDDYSTWQLGNTAAISAYTGTAKAASIAANRISYQFDFVGPSMAIDTACSSSLVAIHQAGHALRQGECALALVGGVNLLLAPQMSIALSQAGMLAADGRCKTFDAAADGYVRGEGCVMLVLKRLDDALRDGDQVAAIIRGSAVNQDGRSNGLTAPNGLAQQRVVRRWRWQGCVPMKSAMSKRMVLARHWVIRSR